VRDTLAFDLAVKSALDFAQADGSTLVVVTADHETAGPTVLSGDLEGRQPAVAWATKLHTAMPVPVYAFGPGAERFAGVYQNVEIARRMSELLDVQRLPKVIGQDGSPEGPGQTVAP
jgi:alkaline phosphatase